MKLRDLLAAPFWMLGQKLEYLAISIGGKWTAEMVKEQAIKIGKLYENPELIATEPVVRKPRTELADG